MLLSSVKYKFNCDQWFRSATCIKRCETQHLVDVGFFIPGEEDIDRWTPKLTIEIVLNKKTSVKVKDCLQSKFGKFFCNVPCFGQIILTASILCQ